MKTLWQTALGILLVSLNSLVSAADRQPTLLLTMEVKEGEMLVGSPKLSVTAGKRASLRIGTAAAGTELAVADGWSIDALPTLAPTGEVLTSFQVKYSVSSAGGSVRTRNLAVETKQMPGETITIQIPGEDGEPPLSLHVKADIVARLP